MNAERVSVGNEPPHPGPPPQLPPHQLPTHQLLGLAGLVAGAGMQHNVNVSNNVNIPTGPSMSIAPSQSSNSSPSTSSDLARNIPSSSTPSGGGNGGGLGDGGGGGGGGGMGGMIPGMGTGVPRPPLPPGFFNLDNNPGMPWGGWADLQDSMAMERGRSRNWTYEETLELISLYTSDEWQNKFSNEKKNHRAIWVSLAAALTRRKDVSGDEARQRLNNLKALYNRTRRQLLSGEITSPQWEYWEPLHSFLGRPQPYIPITSSNPQPRPPPLHGYGHHQYPQHHTPQHSHHHPHPHPHPHQGLFGALGLSPQMHYPMNVPPRPFVKPTPDISFDDITKEGLTGGDDRGSSEHSQNEEETTLNASPEQFMAEGSDRDATPAPSVQTPPKPESYQLRHNNHLTIVLEALARDEAFMDVTLTAQGRSLKAHKSVLSAVSPYFRGVLRENPCQHPIIIMPRDVRFEELFSIVNYIYKGEMTVAADDLTSLLKTAEILQVSGLAPSDSSATVNPNTETTAVGNTRASSASSSSSSSNTASATKTSKNGKETNQGISASQTRPKSPDGMINPSDFMDMDMTYVKEEVNSGGEEDEDTATSETSAQPNENDSPKTNEAQEVYPLSYSSSYNNQTEGQGGGTASSASSSQDLNSSTLKNENGTASDVESSKNGVENPKPFVCPYCQNQHRGIENMTNHLRVNHPTKPGFTCGCGRVFTRSMPHQAHTKVCSGTS